MNNANMCEKHIYSNRKQEFGFVNIWIQKVIILKIAQHNLED